MKFKLYKKNGNWHSSVHIGKGGISSMIAGRCSKSIWYCLGVFKWKNIYCAWLGKKPKRSIKGSLWS